MMALRHRSQLLCALAVCALVGAGASPAAATSPGQPAKPTRVRLSDERATSRWAHAVSRAVVHRGPAAASPTTGHLRLFTEDGFPEVYLVLASWTVGDRTWLKIRIPGRPNGRTGWVRADALGALHLNRFQLVVDRSRLQAALYRSRKVVWSAPIGVGAAGTRTPPGRFYVREKLRFRDTPVYGTHAIGTSAYAPTLTDWPGGGVVGLHGTDQPQLIPGRPSHGCVRIRNEDIRRLWNLIPLGTPIWIR